MNLKPLWLVVWCFVVINGMTAERMAYCASDESSGSIELESGIYYTVKKGDTLWDISNRYFNTHWRWPQIWSENQQIMNPHRIFPGERLRLYHQFWEASVPPELPDQPAVAAPMPVVESKYYVYSSIHRIGFIKEEIIPAAGYISLIRGDKEIFKTIMGQDENIYISPSGVTPLHVGDMFAVYRPPIPVRDPESKRIIDEAKKIVGYQYLRTGLIRIVETRENFAVAKIEKAFRTVMLDDILLPYTPISSKVKLNPVTEEIDGHIFRAEEDIKILGDDTIAFIDRGSLDGVQTGQTYSICEEYATETMRDLVNYGSFLVLHTEAMTSTVLILRSDRTIRTPVRFRTPLPLQNQ